MNANFLASVLPLYLPPFSTLCSAAQPNLNTGGDPTASPGSRCTVPYQTVLLLAEASPRLSAAGPGSGGHQAPPHSPRAPRCPVRGSSTLHCFCVQCLTGLVPPRCEFALIPKHCAINTCRSSTERVLQSLGCKGSAPCFPALGQGAWWHGLESPGEPRREELGCFPSRTCWVGPCPSGRSEASAREGRKGTTQPKFSLLLP